MSMFMGSDRSPSSELFFAGRAYPDPFVNYTSLILPKTMEETLRWCESLWLHVPVYAAACRRVVGYFLTDIEISDVDDTEVTKQKKFLNDVLKITSQATIAGESFMAYGNTFTSVYTPFVRMLACPHKGCGRQVPLRELPDVRFAQFKFNWKCPHCGKACTADKPMDRKLSAPEKVKLIFWSPHQIKIRHHYVSQSSVYLWDIPALFKRQIREGDPFALAETPWEIIEAIKANKMFEFAPGALYHQADYSLPGINTGGWGMPRFLPNFTQAIYIQMLKLYNQVLAAEYIVPMRVLSPKGSGSGSAGDPMLNSSLGSFVARMNAMTRQFRRQPGGWYSSPYPVEYQVMGGEGMTMATHEMIGNALDEMLNAAGVPAELYKGSLAINETPVALRLFQSTWPHFVASNNGWLQWLAGQFAAIFNWQKATYRFKTVTLADDLENKQILLQLAASKQVSREVAFAPLGVDPVKDRKVMLREQADDQEAAQKAQEEQQQKMQLTQQLNGTAQQQGQPGQPGQQGAAGGTGSSVEDRWAQADAEATRLLQMPDDGQRRQELHKLQSTDEPLWSMVKGIMQKKRSQAGTQGGKMILQGQQQ